MLYCELKLVQEENVQIKEVSNVGVSLLYFTIDQ